MTGDDDSKTADAGADLFGPAQADPPAGAPDGVARAFALADSGRFTTIDSISGQLGVEGVAGVDALLFDPKVRKALRQACAEARIALLRRGRIV